MTHHVIKILEDGTRVYSNYTRYKPKSDEERINKRRKPDHPDAVLYKGRWFIPLKFLPDDARELPETRPDTDAYAHVEKPRRCKCDVCKRPEAKKWKLLRKRELRKGLPATEL